MRAFSPLFVLACVLVTTYGFQVAPLACRVHKNVAHSTKQSAFLPLQMSNDPDEEQRVRVDLVEDVDSFTLTAIGFGLIAFNFLVLANMGDGGVGGLVARFINFWNS